MAQILKNFSWICSRVARIGQYRSMVRIFAACIFSCLFGVAGISPCFAESGLFQTTGEVLTDTTFKTKMAPIGVADDSIKVDPEAIQDATSTVPQGVADDSVRIANPENEPTWVLQWMSTFNPEGN